VRGGGGGVRLGTLPRYASRSLEGSVLANF
jgi:hypothetical protein